MINNVLLIYNGRFMLLRLEVSFYLFAYINRLDDGINLSTEITELVSCLSLQVWSVWYRKIKEKDKKRIHFGHQNSLQTYCNLSRYTFQLMPSTRREKIGSFSINDGNGNDNAIKLWIWLVECGKIIVLHVLHVRHALMNKSMPSSAKQQREITTFAVLMNTWAYNR